MAALAPLRIDGPLPTAPDYGLVTTPGLIVDPGDDHALLGVRVDSYPDELPSQHDPCSEGTSREKDIGDDPPNPEFASFTVYLPVTCSGIGIGNEEGAERLRGRVLQAFQAVEGFGVEEEFSRGTANSDKPYLADGQGTAVHTAVGPREGLSVLEQAIGLTAREGVVHLDPATFVAMDAYGLFHDDGDRKMTNRGNLVIIGNGYIGAQPGGAALAGTDNAYAFATGPVRLVRSEPVVHGPTREALDRDTNLITFRAERHYVAYWDTALQFAQRVDRSLSP